MQNCQTFRLLWGVHLCIYVCTLYILYVFWENKIFESLSSFNGGKGHLPPFKGPMQTRSPCIQEAPTDKGPLHGHSQTGNLQGALTDREFIQTRDIYSKGPLKTMSISYRQGALTDNKGPLQTIRGLYRQLVALQTRGSIDTVQLLQTRCPYRWEPLQTRVLCRPEALTDKGPLQTLCNFYRQGPLHEIQASDPTDREPVPNKGLFNYSHCSIRTGKGPYKQGTPTRYTAKGPLQGLHTSKGTSYNMSYCSPRFQENNPFLICLFFKTKISLQIGNLVWYKADLTSNRMKFSHRFR